MLVFTQMLETADERLKMEQIFHTYGNLMFHVANKILNNDHDAEDAVQQALFSIYQNLGKFSEIKCPQSRSFIVTIVERKAIDLYRQSRETQLCLSRRNISMFPPFRKLTLLFSERIWQRQWLRFRHGIVSCCSSSMITGIQSGNRSHVLYDRGKCQENSSACQEKAGINSEWTGGLRDMKITDELLYQHAAEARDIWLDTLPNEDELPIISFPTSLWHPLKP